MEATRDPTFGGALRAGRERGFLIGSHVPQVPIGMVLLTAMSDGRQDHSQDSLVGQVLRDRGLATLSIRLLSTAEEAQERRRRYLRFHSELFAERLEAMVDWVNAIPTMEHVKVVRALQQERGWAVRGGTPHVTLLESHARAFHRNGGLVSQSATPALPPRLAKRAVAALRLPLAGRLPAWRFCRLFETLLSAPQRSPQAAFRAPRRCNYAGY